MSRRSDSMDREEYADKKRHKRDGNRDDMPLQYIRDKARNEQTVSGHRRQDRDINDHSSDRHRRHEDRHQTRDTNEKYDRSRHQRDGREDRHSDHKSRYKGNESKHLVKSEEFWSKEAKDMTKTKDEKEVKEKERPNLGTTGKLAEDTNTYNGVVIKYNEPPEARKPKRKWRLYPFKGEESLPFIPIHRQSAYLMGRDRKVADIPIDHPSCSKQHSVVQFRLVEYKREDESVGKRLRPYIIDLESSNGTFVNNQKIDPKRYYEVFEKDVIKFGFSTREYVLLHDQSKDEEEDDDIEEEVIIKDEPKDD